MGLPDENVVAILGAGPAGMMAAQAVSLAGRTPIIYSPKEPSKIPGAAYLHKPVPDVTDATPDGSVRYLKRGTRAGYARKVYGDEMAPCSWDEFEEGEYPAWSLRRTYERLWEMFSPNIVPGEVNADDVEMMLTDYPLVISSIPKTVICRARQQHEFHSRHYWHSEKATWYCRPNELVYSGNPEDEWYRTSRIFGHQATEFIELPDLDKWRWRINPGEKPISNNCDCWEERNILFVGRFGEWTKGVLAHHAFERAFSGMFEVFEGA
jgi:hypothetical protein